MIIEQTDRLVEWLVKELTPICDAEPAALAKYVLALLKKPDKTDEELKEFSLSQLEVFLQAGTKKFVEKMFQTLKDKSYIPEPPSVEIEEPKPKTDHPTESPVKKSAGASGSEHRRQQTGQRGRDKENEGKPSSSREVKSAVIDSAENKVEPLPRRRGPPPPASANAPTNADRAPPRRPGPDDRKDANVAGQADRERERDRERPQRKRISPPAGASDIKREPVPRGGNEYAGAGVRRRSRSPRPERRGVGGGRGPLGRRQSPQDRGDRERPERGHRRRSRSRSRSPRSRSPREERRKRRCKNYDEQGFCLRGDQCPYDHGPDPVVVDDSALDNIVNRPGAKNLPTNFSMPPPGYSPINPPPPGVEQAPHNVYVPASSQSGIVEGYNPETPALTAGGAPNYSVPPPPLPVHMSAAPWRATPYSVPTSANVVVGYDPSGGIPIDPSSAPPHSSAGPPSHYLNSGSSTRGGPPMRGRGRGRVRGHYMGRGAAHGSASSQHSNSLTDGRTLQVKKIPPEQNNIAKLNEHFAQFGNIVNMQVRYGDVETALITFASKHEATAAYKSPTPVLNNRFIKVFFYQQPEAATTPGEQTGSGATQSGNQPKTTPISGAPSSEPAEKPPPQKVASVSESKFVNPEMKEKRQKLQMAKLRLKKEKPAYQILLELQRRNVALLQKLIENQKTVIVKAKAATGEKSKNAAYKLVKDIQEKIKTSKESVDKTASEIAEKKKLLEELQTILQESKPQTTEGVKTGVEEKESDETDEGVKQESAELGTLGGGNKLKRPAEDLESDEDELLEKKRKPGKLIVRGFDAKDEPELIEHLEKIGDLRDFDLIPASKPLAAVVTFKRYEAAERALIEGRNFPGSATPVILQMEWYTAEAAAEGLTVVPDKERAADQQLNANQLLASISKSEESDEDAD